jgi:hypothetical protein
MRLPVSLLTGAALTASLLLPAVASAAPLPSKMLPAGFCTVAEDSTRGVRFDGASYTAWLAVNALADQVALRRDLVSKHQGNELAADQEMAQLRKEAANYQRLYIDRGQNHSCSK